eukprot:NODE_18_length_47517_cov_0.674814.p28 type:complete len:114 gc:universal NODE_18_length_47517_cov_0.674814:14803-15144(+)
MSISPNTCENYQVGFSSLKRIHCINADRHIHFGYTFSQFRPLGVIWSDDSNGGFLLILFIAKKQFLHDCHFFLIIPATIFTFSFFSMIDFDKSQGLKKAVFPKRKLLTVIVRF